MQKEEYVYEVCRCGFVKRWISFRAMILFIRFFSIDKVGYNDISFISLYYTIIQIDKLLENLNFIIHMEWNRNHYHIYSFIEEYAIENCDQFPNASESCLVLFSSFPRLSENGLGSYNYKSGERVAVCLRSSRGALSHGRDRGVAREK